VTTKVGDTAINSEARKNLEEIAPPPPPPPPCLAVLAAAEPPPPPLPPAPTHITYKFVIFVGIDHAESIDVKS
jgi:hypothetical protein